MTFAEQNAGRLVCRRINLRRDRWDSLLALAREQFGGDLFAAIDATLARALDVPDIRREIEGSP